MNLFPTHKTKTKYVEEEETIGNKKEIKLVVCKLYKKLKLIEIVA